MMRVAHAPVIPDVLQDPIRDKGTAFTQAERDALGLTGHYRAELGGREAIAELKALVGLAERRPEDELHQLLQRAETSLTRSRA